MEKQRKELWIIFVILQNKDIADLLFNQLSDVLFGKMVILKFL